MNAGGGVRVEARGIGVVIGKLTVLEGVDASFAPGTVTALVGPSGSGKTTLLTVVGRHWQPTSGQVDLATPDGAAPRISLVFQAFALLSLLTAIENVELAGQVRGVKRGRVRVRARHCLSEVGLLERSEHLVEELSGGEQQRVALARALMTDPQLLLADEPTAQLDPVNRERVIELLRSLANSGATVVIGTHDPEVAGRCDAVVRLESGRRVG